jgi:hypothetical protein
VDVRVTEDELILAAHYRFGRRLSDVIAATLGYQRDKRTHDRCLAEAAETSVVLATAQRLAPELPANLGLLELALAQDARAHRELERSGERMRSSAEVFIETVGGAAPDVVAAMEAHGWSLDRPRLLAALRERAGLVAEL